MKKPGWYSSESHLVLATLVISSLVFFGYVPASDKETLVGVADRTLNKVAAVAAQVAALVTYIRSRTKIKLQAMDRELEPEPPPPRPRLRRWREPDESTDPPKAA